MSKKVKEEEIKEEAKPSEIDLQTEIDKWKNQYYMVLADMQNLRKQLERDHTEAIKYRASGFVEELLPALDSFHYALNAEPNSEEAKNYKIGFDYIYKMLIAALENEGVKEITPKLEDSFDVKFMQAMDTVEEEGEPQRVTKVYASAYYLKDRLIRPARVQVRIKAKEEPEQEPATEEVAKA